MVVVNLINENDNIPNIICQPVQVREGLLEGSFLTTIDVGNSYYSVIIIICMIV